MDKQEFLLLIPGIIYGVAIVDLLKIIQHRVNYWEIVLWGVLLMVTIIRHWMELYQKLEFLVDNNLNFFLIIGQAVIYAQAANVITPENLDSDTKAYFFKVRKTFFLIILVSLVFNVLLEFIVFEDHELWLRITGLPIVLACAYINKIWLRAAVGVYIFILSFILIFFQ